MLNIKKLQQKLLSNLSKKCLIIICRYTPDSHLTQHLVDQKLMR